MWCHYILSGAVKPWLGKTLRRRDTWWWLWAEDVDEMKNGLWWTQPEHWTWTHFTLNLWLPTAEGKTDSNYIKAKSGWINSMNKSPRLIVIWYRWSRKRENSHLTGFYPYVAQTWLHLQKIGKRQNKWMCLPVHCCCATFRSWANQDKQLMALILQSSYHLWRRSEKMT